jgi:UPF0271 protein
VLDSSAVVNGANVPPDRSVTTPSVADEFQPGGATRRRLELLLAGGLGVREPPETARQRVDAAARAAGSLGRLSQADRDVLALALDVGERARLVTDDYTVQDVARRLGIPVQGVALKGATGLLDWTARCTGCARTYGAERAGSACPVCGAEIRAKPRRR